MSKPGRNDPCYCGSGEKYKKCHMKADKEAEKEQRQIEDASRWLRRDILKYGREERFAEAFAVAVQLYWNGYYTIENAELMGQNEAFRFFDWFLFDFQYRNQPRLLDVYYEENLAELAEPQKKVLDAWLEAPAASAYELVDYDGQYLNTRDFLTKDEFTIYEAGGHGLVQPGDLLLGRPVRVADRLEFSTVAAFLPQDEIADLSEKMAQAEADDLEEHPGASHEEFMRRRGYLIIHHALEQAELQGRPPVAAKDPERSDKMVQKAAERLRQLQSRL